MAASQVERLSEIVETVLANVPKPEPVVDPYTPQIGTPVEMPFTTRQQSDGRLEFGKQIDARQFMVGKLLVMCTADRKNNRAPQVVIDAFHPRGGIANRTWFKPDNQGDTVQKKYEEQVQDIMFRPFFHRPVIDWELDMLAQALTPPFAGTPAAARALKEVVTLRAVDHDLIAASRADMAASEQELRDNLREADEVRRRAAADMHNYIIY